jgi:hypothetical protein
MVCLPEEYGEWNFEKRKKNRIDIPTPSDP